MTKLSFLYVLAFFHETSKAEEGQKYGEKCIYDGDCIEGLVCNLEDKLFQAQRVCQCDNGLQWFQGQCASEGQEVAEIVTILVPVLTSVVIVFLLVIACCCWIHSSTLSVKAEMKKANSLDKAESEDFEIDFTFPLEDSMKVARPKTSVDEAIKITDNGRQRPKTATVEENLEEEPKRLSVISDLGYQSNMRHLLHQRPTSATFSHSRPNSALFINLDSRPSSSLKLASRSSSACSSRKSSSINGPYLTEEAIRSVHNPKPIKRPYVLENGQALFDKILAVDEAVPKPRPEVKSEENIEEIRLVKVAVNAFKRKRRLRDLKANRKKRKFADIVDKVMQLRENEKKQKPALIRSNSSNTTISSTLSNSSASGSSLKSAKTRPKRPESVAQRVLRERREKNISAKVVETPTSSSNAKKAKGSKRQPLHLALRQSASKHRGSKAARAEQIKSRTHFKAVKNYQVVLRLFNFSSLMILFFRFLLPLQALLKNHRSRVF